jgi:hypothetical protein
LPFLCLTVVRQVRASWNSALRICGFYLALPAWLAVTTYFPPRFQKYRVAPRLGADNVRRRILMGLRDQTALAIAETQRL